MRDLKNNVDVQPSLNPATHTSTPTPGTGVDLQGFNSAMMVFQAGAADTGNADETYIPGIEESDVLGSGYTAVAPGDIDGDVTTLLANTVRRIGYKGNKRFIRAILTIAGTTPSIVSGAHVVRGNPDLKPTA